MNRLVLAVCVALLASPSAFAQVCAGAPSFERLPYRANVVLDADDGATTFGGQFLGGTKAGAFGGVTILGQSVDGLDGTGVGVEALLGKDYAVDAAKKVYVCPVASLGYQAGPDLGIVDLDFISFSGGVRAGIVMNPGGKTLVVPTFGAQAITVRTRASAFDESESVTDHFGRLTVGLGFVFTNAFIVPTIVIPVGLAGADPTFTVSVGFAF